MGISNQDVLKLRKLTGAGVMDCKNALEAMDGDIEAAIDMLRTKGIEVAAKREAKSAAEGVVTASVSDDEQIGVLLEVNCETDFAARSEDFREFANMLATQIAQTDGIQTIEDALEEPWAGDESVKVRDALDGLTGKIGERIVVRRLARYAVTGDAGKIASYVHGGEQIGVLMEISCETEPTASSEELADFAHNIAMQVAAMQPKWVAQDDVDEAALEREREVLLEQAREEGKPEHIVENMVTGRLKKFYSRVCLLSQPYVRDDDITVEELLNELIGKLGEPVAVRRFIRFQVGEDL
jgi:elongation factor Ts